MPLASVIGTQETDSQTSVPSLRTQRNSRSSPRKPWRPFRNSGGNAGPIVGMDQRAREVGHGHAFGDGVAGVFLDRWIDPAWFAIGVPTRLPSSPCNLRSRGNFLLALAQLVGHRGSQPHRAAAAGDHQPGEQRQQQAQTRTVTAISASALRPKRPLKSCQGAHESVQLCPATTRYSLAEMSGGRCCSPVAGDRYSKAVADGSTPS